MSQHNVPLTEAPKPERLNPVPLGTLAGDHHDDDGRAIEQYFEPPSQTPEQHSGIEPKVDALPIPTRILNVKVPLGSEPVPALPADLNRVDCNIISYDGYVIIASEKTDCYYAPMIPPNTLVTLTGHTGPIWIYTEDNSSIGKLVTVNTVTK